MTKWSWAVLALLVPLGAGCFMDHGRGSEPPPPPTTEPPPVTEPPPTVEPPIPGIDIDAVISAAYLGDDCGDGDRSGGGIDADCAIDFCGCNQSAMQLRFTSDESYGDVPVSIVNVALHAFESGDYLQDLEAHTPQTWDETGGYVDWDEVLATPIELNSSYNLTAPDWATIYGLYESPWSMSYQLRVTVEIGGEERVLLSGEIYRISDIDT